MNNDPNQTAYLLKCLMDNTPDLIYFKDRDSKFIMVNKTTADWCNENSPEEMIGTSDLDTYTGTDAQRMRDDDMQVMKSGKPLSAIDEHETWQNGSQAWLSTTKVPLRNETGEVIGIFGISRDITEHKEAEIRAEKLAEEIEEDLLMASQLQKTFFPTSYPHFPSTQSPAEDLVQFAHLHHAGRIIGGDLCSIRKLSETEAGIFLCDVMGHGVRAALGASIIRAVLQEISHQKKDPGEFLGHMNQALMPLFRQGDLFMYATACYMVLDVSTGLLRVANAGHHMPFALRSGNRTDLGLQNLSSNPDPGLAIQEGTIYKTVESILQPGDSIFMCTDGILEVMDANQEEYGTDRLQAAALKNKDLPLPDLFSALHKEACAYSAEGSIDDDVCMVGFRLSK